MAFMLHRNVIKQAKQKAPDKIKITFQRPILQRMPGASGDKHPIIKAEIIVLLIKTEFSIFGCSLIFNPPKTDIPNPPP
jgi:hypothetical protein